MKLSTDKTASKQILDKLVVEAKLAEHDLGGRVAENAKRPLVEHLKYYRAYLDGKGKSGAYVERVETTVQAVLDACRFVRMADVDSAALMTYLVELRSKGRGTRTRNFYLIAMKGFSRWLWQQGRAVADPLAVRKRLTNEAADCRRNRREFSLDELRLMIDTTGKSDRTFRGLTGRDRGALYAAAARTGIRASELASLTPASFDLDSEPPTVRVAAAYSKNRKEALQPIPPDLAAGLRGILDSKSDF